MKSILIALLVVALGCMENEGVSAFAPSQVHLQAPSSTSLFAGGFGGGGAKGKKAKKAKEIKLKPKQQWDRYQEFKRENKVRVAVKCEDSDEWLEVGRVKSKDNANTVIAVARQRALIAEVRSYQVLMRESRLMTTSSHLTLLTLSF